MQQSQQLAQHHPSGATLPGYMSSGPVNFQSARRLSDHGPIPISQTSAGPQPSAHHHSGSHHAPHTHFAAPGPRHGLGPHQVLGGGGSGNTGLTNAPGAAFTGYTSVHSGPSSAGPPQSGPHSFATSGHHQLSGQQLQQLTNSLAGPMAPQSQGQVSQRGPGTHTVVRTSSTGAPAPGPNYVARSPSANAAASGPTAPLHYGTPVRSPSAHGPAGLLMLGSPGGASGSLQHQIVVPGAPVLATAAPFAPQPMVNVPIPNQDLPMRPPPLQLRSASRAVVQETFTHQAIREKYGLALSAEQLAHPDVPAHTINLAQVLLNLSAVREICTVPWLNEVLETLQHALSTAIASLNASHAEDSAFASVADNLVGELLRVVNFATQDSKFLTALSTGAKELKARLAHSQQRREEVEPATEQYRRLIAEEVPIYQELETLFSRAVGLEIVRQQQAGQLIRLVYEDIRDKSEATVTTIKDQSIKLAATGAADIELLSKAQEDEAAEFAREQKALQEKEAATRENLARLRETQAAVAEEIENLRRKLARLKQEEADQQNLAQAVEMKLITNDREHKDFVDNCDVWRKYLDATILNARKKAEASTQLVDFVGRASSCIAKRYADLADELKAVQHESLRSQFEAARGGIISVGRLLNLRLNQLDRIRDDLVESRVEAKSQQFKNSPRVPLWEAEVRHLEAEDAFVKREVERLEEEFQVCKTRFATLERALQQAGIKYRHPGEELVAILEKEAQAEEEKRIKFVQYKREIRTSISRETDLNNATGRHSPSSPAPQVLEFARQGIPVPTATADRYVSSVSQTAKGPATAHTAAPASSGPAAASASGGSKQQTQQ